MIPLLGSHCCPRGGHGGAADHCHLPLTSHPPFFLFVFASISKEELVESFCEICKVFLAFSALHPGAGALRSGPAGTCSYPTGGDHHAEASPPQYIDGRPRHSLIPSFPGPFVTISMTAIPKTNRSVNPVYPGGRKNSRT